MEVREVSGLSRRELSLLAGLAQAQAGMIERGEIAAPSTDTAAKLCAVLGCSLDWLIAGTGEKPSREHVCTAVAAARKRLAA